MSKRITPASHYQRPDSAVRLLAIHGKPAIRRDLKAALSHLESMVPTVPVTYRIKVGAYDQVKDVINWAHWREVLKVPFSRIGALRVAASQMAIAKINRTFKARGRSVRYRPGPVGFYKAIGDAFAFDSFDAGTQERVRQAQDALIQQLTFEARNTVDAIVSAGAKGGLGADEIVGDIRELIGLTDNQAAAVLNYRGMLQTGDLDALRRQLRDPSLDAKIRAAAISGRDLDQFFIDNAVEKYRQNFLDYRSNAIAQTESVRAVNAGLRDSYRQAIERGALPGDAIRRHWKVSMTETTCPVCLSIPELNPDGVGVDEDFQSSDGPQDDSPVHPHCACEVEYVTDIDKIPDDPTDGE